MKKRRIHIKVCGMTRQDNLKELCMLKPDFVGFIFYPPSPRYVDVECSGELFEVVPEGIGKVGVFVNEKLDKMLSVADRAGLDYLQLHGNESPEVCGSLVSEGKKLIKMIPGGLMDDKGILSEYEELADYLLFDTPSKIHGGTGKKFNWEDIKKEVYNIPFLLSGGVGIEDIPEINKVENPAFFGLDLNSRFESSAGVKDINLLQEFFNKIAAARE